ELKRFREEILFADLEILSNRLSKVQANLRKPKPAKEREADQLEEAILRRLITALEAGQSPKDLGLKEEEEKIIRPFQLLTLKPEMVLVNKRESHQTLPAELAVLAPQALAAPVQLELELAELSPEDRTAFAPDLRVSGSERDDIL